MNTVDRIEKAIRELSELEPMPPSSLPGIPLYVEQVIALMTQENRAISLFRGDKPMTRAMINNYTKAGILPHPAKKQYGSEHIYRLNYLFLFKQVLSMEDLSLLFGSDCSDSCYGVFCRLISENRKEIFLQLRNRLDRVQEFAIRNGITDENEIYRLFICMTAMEAAAGQALCRRLLQTQEPIIHETKEK